MGPKRNRQEKAALRRSKNAARKDRQQGQSQDKSDQNNDGSFDFEDDVPKMKIQLERLGLVLKEVEGDG